MAGFPSVNHLALTVTDLEVSVDWYQRLFDVAPAMDEGPVGVRQAAAHPPRPSLVHRRGLPPSHRASAQPGRGHQRLAAVHLLRQPGSRPLPPPRRSDDPGPLPHPRRQRLVLSTTGYLEDAIDAQEADGHQVSDQAKAHISPAHFEAINPYGALIFDIAGVLKRSRRPLRRL